MSSAPKTSRATKTTKAAAASTSTTTTAAATATPVAAPAPVVAAPVVAATPVAAATETTTVAATEQVNIVSEFNAVLEQVNTLRSSFGVVFSAMKKLEKQIPRELKKAQKGRRRRAVLAEGEEAKPKKDTVFTKPTPISDALCTFLSLPKGSSLSRSEVTTRICKYAKDHSLMVKQVIKADAPLRKLLALTEADELKILNLQRYLKGHYLKPAVPATTTA
jgi:chromatin remodeling complex protein RSC6